MSVRNNMATTLRLATVLLALWLLAGCSGTAPFTDWGGERVYHVQSGDTLYAIAMANNLDWRDIARWNNISDPRRLRVGQRLVLSGSGAPPPARQTGASTASSAAASRSSRSQTTRSTTSASRSAIDWHWPADGKVTETFAANTTRQGIIIESDKGQAVKAAAGGDVVYSGDGLPGYGNLLIIKHDGQWLSAYAYNQRLLVEEGASVSQGDHIANMGQREQTRNNNGQLLFQIRYEGKPVNPQDHLPAR